MSILILAPIRCFAWRWYIELPIRTPLDERTREGDDHPARLFLRFLTDHGEKRAMEVIWGTLGRPRSSLRYGPQQAGNAARGPPRGEIDVLKKGRYGSTYPKRRRYSAISRSQWRSAAGFVVTPPLREGKTMMDAGI